MLVMKLREETIFLAITHALNMNNKYFGAEMILGNIGMKMFCLALFCSGSSVVDSMRSWCDILRLQFTYQYIQPPQGRSHVLACRRRGKADRVGLEYAFSHFHTSLCTCNMYSESNVWGCFVDISLCKSVPSMSCRFHLFDDSILFPF